MGVPLVSCNCLVQVEKGSGDRSKGRQVHGIGLFSCGMQSHFQQLIGFLRALYVTLELSVVEGLEDFAFLWMRLSLEEFLEANDPNRTIEGLPAPRRAILSANVT
mgnify:CR=1 FL=1